MNAIAVADAYTGRVLDLPNTEARDRIEQGTAIETVPSDPVFAERWVAALRERVMLDAHQRGYVNDIPAFEEYARWCAKRGCHPLPVTVGNLTLFLLGLIVEGAQAHELPPKIYSIERIHALANHPPRHLGKLARDSLARALAFAKAKVGIADLTKLERQVPFKALEMFPDGVVPMRWSDID